MVVLQEYLSSAFPGLLLKPSLINQWDIGVHVEFGEGIYQFNEDGSLNHNRFDTVYRQALSIFHDLFSEQDDLLLVTNVYWRKNRKEVKTPINVYSRYIKRKERKWRVKQELLPDVLEGDEAGSYDMVRFILKCKKEEILYPLLIKAVCNEDFSLKPKLGGKGDFYYPDVFFVNMTKHIIYFIYDDRGAEVMARDQKSLRPIYVKYNDWLDENSRTKMDHFFHKSNN